MAKILVVDDQACIRELLSEELSSEGYTVATAGDPESAKGHLRFSLPDLVLLDLHLDGFKGIELLHDIKETYPELPVIIFTAYDSYLDHPQLSRADDYVMKSVVFDELKQKIADLIMQEPAPGTAEELEPRCPELLVAHGH